MPDFRNKRPDAMQRSHRRVRYEKVRAPLPEAERSHRRVRYEKVRAPLPEAERSQLDRLVASLGAKAAASALGVDEATLARARTGAALQSVTLTRLRESGWIVTNPA